MVEVRVNPSRGPQGPPGPGTQINASGTTAGRATYDNEATGFTYADTSVSPVVISIKQSATAADWGPYFPFQGPKGDTGATGPAGPQGAAGEDGVNWAPDATGTLTGRNTYDAQAKGFAYFATDGALDGTGALFVKLTATAADWSGAIPYRGAQGERGDVGPQGIPGPQGKSAVPTVKDYGAKGKQTITTVMATGTAGSRSLTFSAIDNFVVGDGILVNSGGAWSGTEPRHLHSRIENISGTTVTLEHALGHDVTGTLVEHDDSLAFQACWDNEPVHVIPPLPDTSLGYNIGKDIILRSNRTSIGYGYASRMRRVGDITTALRRMFFFTNTSGESGLKNVEMRGYYVDGDKARAAISDSEQAGHHVMAVLHRTANAAVEGHAERGENVKLIDFYVKDSPGPGIRVESVTRLTLRGVDVISPQRGGIILCYANREVQMHGCRALDSGDDAVAFNGAAGGGATEIFTGQPEKIEISGLHARVANSSRGGGALAIRGGKDIKATGLLLEGGKGGALMITESTDTAKTHQPQYITITGLHIRNTSAPFIDTVSNTEQPGAPGIRIIGKDVRYVNISDFAIHNTGGHGIYYLHTSGGTASIQVEFKNGVINTSGGNYNTGYATDNAGKGIYILGQSGATQLLRGVGIKDVYIGFSWEEALSISGLDLAIRFLDVDITMESPVLSGKANMDGVSVSSRAGNPEGFAMTLMGYAPGTNRARHWANVQTGASGRVISRLLQNSETTSGTAVLIAAGLADVLAV